MSTVVIPPRRPRLDRLKAGSSGNLARAIFGNRKALAGLIVLAIFVFLALFPWVLAHDNPNAEIYKRSAGPSAAHLFGTTSYRSEERRVGKECRP